MFNDLEAQKRELNGPARSLITALAAAEVIYSLSAMEAAGMKPYGEYATSAVLELAGAIGDFRVPADAAHFFAWHYMYKYDGSNATASGMTASIEEYVKSEFMPWGIIEINGDKANCTYISGQGIELQSQKLKSARIMLDIAVAAGAGSGAIKGIKGQMEALRLSSAFAYIDRILGDTEYNPLFGSQFKPAAQAIFREITKESDIPESHLALCIEVSAMISLSWNMKKEITLKNLLAEMEDMPSRGICFLLSSMEATSKGKEAKAMIAEALVKALEGNRIMRNPQPAAKKTWPKNNPEAAKTSRR